MRLLSGEVRRWSGALRCLVLLILGACWLLAVAYAVVGLVKWLMPHVPRTIAPALVVLSAAILALAFFAFVRIVERRPVHELALRPCLRELAVGVAGGLTLMVVPVALLGFLGVARIQWEGDWGGLAWLAATQLFVAVREETKYRGLLLGITESTLGTVAAVVLSSALFAFGHRLNPRITWWAMVSLGLSDLVFAAVYLITRRLWLPIGLHLGWNLALGGVLGMRVSGMSVAPALFSTTLSGHPILTGGAFGFEQSVFGTLPACLLGIWLLVAFARSGKLKSASIATAQVVDTNEPVRQSVAS